MDAGTLVWILLIGGGVAAMLFMHRGGHSHGGSGGGGCGSHGHGHGSPSSDEEQEPRKNDSKELGKRGSHDHDREPAAAGSKHRGC